MLTLDIASDDHDEPAMVIGMVSMVDSSNNFASADNFFHGHQHQLDGQERDAFVEQVKGTEEDEIPVVFSQHRQTNNTMCYIKM